MSTTRADLRFDPPESGFWTQDPVHFPQPLTRYWTETHPEGFARGTAEFARNYGMMIGGLAMIYPNGIGYNTVLPPPEEEIPARFARAEEVLATRFWRRGSGVSRCANGRRRSSRPRSRPTWRSSPSIPTRSRTPTSPPI